MNAIKTKEIFNQDEIDISNEAEVNYWSEKLQVSKEELIDAVKISGSKLTGTVRKYLNK